MNHTTTIRAELDTYMKTNGLNITRLGRTAGLNAGMVSTLVKWKWYVFRRSTGSD
ncbi:UNVERIFIED_CONTAM: hypothetical protein ABIC26_004434 [Paenibacillus sp. PvR008]